jgi:hypothetical protein
MVALQQHIRLAGHVEDFSWHPPLLMSHNCHLQPPQLPDSIWVLDKESVLGVCPANTLGSSSSGNASNLAGGSSSGGSEASVAGPFKLLGGALEVLISKASDPSKMRVQITGKFDNGYIGFGVAKPGEGW